MRPASSAPLAAPFRRLSSRLAARRRARLARTYAGPALAILLPGCQNGASHAGSNAGGDGGTFRIGVITSLTGLGAAFGQAHKNGYAIAVRDINAHGGILGKRVELAIYDDQSRPDQAVQGVSKLADQDRVPLILGAYSSESTRAIVPVVTQKQIPLIIPTATADNVMDTGSRWVFRICAGSDAVAAATIDFLRGNGNPKTLAVVYENTNFGQSNDRSMTGAAAAAGLTIVAHEAYQASSPDYKSLLQRVKAKNPEAVYFASYLLDATTLMRQAEQVDFNPRFYTSAGTGFAAAEFPTDKGAGRYAEYTFSVSQWLPTAHWAGSQEFDAAFFALTGTHPAYHAMQAYAALMVAADAVNRAKSDNRQAVLDAIRSTDVQTPFGPVKFDGRGQNPHPVLTTQVQNGRYQVVWPLAVAEAHAIVPVPTWRDRK